MKSLIYFEQLEKALYKSVLEGDKEMISFLSKEENIALDSLSKEEIDKMLDSIFTIHPSLLLDQAPTDTLILYQIDDKLPIKRLVNKLIESIFKNQFDEIIISPEINKYLINEGVVDQYIFNDCLAFRNDYVERIIGRIFENKQISNNTKNKIIKDLFFTYYELEDDRKNIHNIESADTLSKRFAMIDDFLNINEQEGVYISLCLENIIANIENEEVVENEKIKNVRRNYTNIQVESLLTPLPVMSLVGLEERLNYEFYNSNACLDGNIYCEETEKVLKKLLINNVNKWLSKR